MGSFWRKELSCFSAVCQPYDLVEGSFDERPGYIRFRLGQSVSQLEEVFNIHPGARSGSKSIDYGTMNNIVLYNMF